MTAQQLVMLAFQVSILCTVFGFGLNATKDDLFDLLRRPGLLLRSIAAVFVIMPIVAVALARMFDVRPATEVALVALAISPLPPILPGKEMKAGGKASYGLALMAILGLLSVVVVPVAAALIGWWVGRPIGASGTAIGRIVLMSTLLPLVAGMALRAWLPSLANLVQRPIALAARILLPLAVLALLVGSWRAMADAIGDGSVIEIVVFVAIGLAVGHLLGGPEPDEAVVLALSTATRHPAIGLAIASANFPEQRFGGTILLYLVVGAIVGIPYLRWRRSATAARAAA
jgi:BASS family bile acid:Na+ symporter